MTKRFARHALAGALMLALAAPALAQSRASPDASAPAAPRKFETAHEGVFGGKRIRYHAIVEEHFAADPSGKRGASIFTTSYVRTDAPKGTVRPIIFAFNGGPGSSSIWLHMGFLGPVRADMDNVAAPETTPPFRTVANEDSPLDVADIVLIDPPGTGYSQVLPGARTEDFYGVAQDARAVSDVIQQWVRANGRWNDPKYLVSESYGTVRAAALAKLLAGGPMETGRMDAIALNGVILLGQAMDMSARGSVGDDRTYLNLLPTLAATACFFGKAPAGCTPEGQAEAARRFNRDTYLAALYAGAQLDAAGRDGVAQQLSTLTGLSKTDILAENLRIGASSFSHKLLAGDSQRIGHYDSRYTLSMAVSGNDPVADDPAMGQYVPGFVAAWNGYARGHLKVTLDQPYEPIAFRAVNGRWDYGFGPGIPVGRNFAVDLATAMTRNPNMRLFVGTGYYDLVTPIGAAEYTVTHSGIPLDRTQFFNYASGHMPYVGAEPRRQLATDIRAFVSAAR